MNFLSLFAVFDINNSEQQLWTRKQNFQLCFGLLMDAWIVSIFMLIHQGVNDRNKFLWFPQENLIFNAWPINKLLKSINDKRQHGKCAIIRENKISNRVDNICKAHHNLVNQINGSNLLLNFEVFNIVHLLFQEQLCWLEAILAKGVQELEKVVHFFRLPGV